MLLGVVDVTYPLDYFKEKQSLKDLDKKKCSIIILTYKTTEEVKTK
jgi:hypothetical protein